MQMRTAIMAGQVQTGPLNETHTHTCTHTHTHTCAHTHINETDELNMGGLGLGDWEA